MDKIYTTQEVANRLKIKKTTVYELIKRGELKANKVGKQLRVSQQHLEEYLGLHHDAFASPTVNHTFAYTPSDIPALPADAAIRQVDYLLNTSGLIISSQESTLVELLRSQLECIDGSLPMLHSYMNDYNSLYSLYYEKTHLALVSVCPADHSNGEDFIHSLLPGTPVTLLHLYDFQVGFYVKKGNPKKIHTAADLCRPDVRIANREKGNSCRILLDSLLHKNNIPAHRIQGYHTDVLSHMSLANAILAQKADTGIGDMAQLAAYPQLECIPLTMASMYLVFQSANQNHPAFQAVLSAVSSDNFKSGLKHFDGYIL